MAYRVVECRLIKGLAILADVIPSLFFTTTYAWLFHLSFNHQDLCPMPT